MAETNDISVDALEEIVRTGGDELVTGFVRFKKVHKCNGYKDAGHKAAVRFSKITGGRILENNKYAAVIRFRWIILLILFALVALLFGIWRITGHAEEKDAEKIVPATIDVLPSVDNRGDFIPDTMDVPGFSDITLTDEYKNIILYNPSSNYCMLKYTIISDGICLYESGYLHPGDVVEADIFNRLVKGIYSVEIITTGYTEEAKELNSARQNINITRN